MIQQTSLTNGTDDIVKQQYTELLKGLLNSELNAGNLIKTTTTTTVLEEFEKTTRTMLTKQNNFHPNTSVLRTALPKVE